MIGKLSRVPLRQVWPHHREKRHSEEAASIRDCAATRGYPLVAFSLACGEQSC